jgi:predicted SprT family Zn-dependent metalloprotease
MTERDLIVSTLALMELFGLTPAWRMALTRGKHTVGSTNYSTRVISISAAVLPFNTPAQVRELILHEIAHAMVGARRGEHHGEAWRRQAVALGCSGERHPEIVYPRGAWRVVCDRGCGYCKEKHTALTQKQRAKARSCPVCGPSRGYSAEYRLRIEEGC